MHMYPPTPANCNGERAGKEELLTTRTKGVFSSCWPFSKDFGNNIIINNNENRNKNKNNGDNKSGQFCWPILFYGM